MKVLLALVFLCVAVTVGLIIQAVIQELKLHNLKVNMLGEEDLVKRKIEEVTEIKLKVQKLKDQLANADAHVMELTGKKGRTEKALMAYEVKMQNCNKDKDDAMMKKATVEGNITKVKAEQEKAKSRAEAEIEKLKEQIFQRDKIICPFADMSKAEAQTLCGVEKEVSV